MDGTPNPKSGTMKLPVLILESTTPIGRATVQAAIDSGRPVIAASANATELRELGDAYADADLTPLLGDFATEMAAEALATAIADLDRPLGGVIVAGTCEPPRGRVIDEPAKALRHALERDLIPHLSAARALIPLLAEARRNGTYLVLSGPGADHPWAGYGHRSVAAAALQMLVRVLHDEARPHGVRVQMLTADKPARTDANEEHACAHWPTAMAIATQAMALVDQLPAQRAPEPIVRFSLPTPSSLPDRRAIHARRPLSGAARSTTHVHDPTPAVAPAGDDAGALLRSLLSSENDKA
jgi:NAD(P)-dependent dehydrogenase (short-subunit alcohol dehydrogenase family)